MAARSVTSASIATRLAAFAFDLGLQRLQAVGPPRHQRDGGAVVGERLGELDAEAAGGAGHQRHAPLQIEHLGGFHASLYTPRTAIWNRPAGTARVISVQQAGDSGGWRETTLASDRQ